MSDFNRGISQPTPVVTDMSVDAGLRGFMLGVYNKVGLGLVVSAALAWVTGTYPPVQQLLFSVDAYGHLNYTILGMVVAFAPLVILLSQMFMRRASPGMAAFTYWSIVSLIGASFGLLFIVYSDVSIFQTFLVTACAFGGLSLVGYTTKRDLSGMGSFLIMGLWGLIFAMLAAFFFHSSALYFAINLIGVLIFAGLIAWDTQRLKLMYHQVGGDTAAMSVATNYGALSLYLDFVNLFRFLLYFMGGSRR
ncbi:MAG TPA: Bax inhibitor-1/YccA family protein [Caulobacteraceae bacterium]|nr:Bax inhibitor-1/YccA family protein [Caulobacteraceae bacterium]